MRLGMRQTALIEIAKRGHSHLTGKKTREMLDRHPQTTSVLAEGRNIADGGMVVKNFHHDWLKEQGEPMHDNPKIFTAGASKRFRREINKLAAQI